MSVGKASSPFDPQPSHRLRKHQDDFDFKRWCSWSFQSCKAQYSCTLLLVFWAGMEARVKYVSELRACQLPLTLLACQTGVNPFAVLHADAPDSARNASFEKVIDLLVRATLLQGCFCLWNCLTCDALRGSDGRAVLQPVQVPACPHATFPGNDGEASNWTCKQ